MRASSSRTILKAVRPASRSAALSPRSRKESTSAETWQPALPQGQNEAYDLSLHYLSEHRSKTLSRLSKNHSDLPSYHPTIEKLQIEAHVNDPSTRRRYNDLRASGSSDGMGDVVMRYLRDNEWKKKGGLDLLMQRVEQLGVVPDVTPSVTDLQPITLSINGTPIEAGSFPSIETLSSPPKLRVQLLSHPVTPTETDVSPSAKFTLLVLDADSPDHLNNSYTERIHYLKTDIPLSVVSGDVDLFAQDAGGNEIWGWEPPAPPKGSGKHRFVFIVIQQSSNSTPSTTEITQREPFSLRSYLNNNSLSAESIKSLTLVRGKYTPESEDYITSTYAQHRGEQMPVYGKPPKELRYGYPMSAKAERAQGVRDEAWSKMGRELEEEIQAELGYARGEEKS